MVDVRGLFLGLPHGTIPAAVTTNKNIKMSSFKSSENIQKKGGGPVRSVSDNQSSSVTLNEMARSILGPDLPVLVTLATFLNRYI